MRAAGLVDAERDGREIRYRLADPDVIVACGVMRGVLERRLAPPGSPAADDAPPDATVLDPDSAEWSRPWTNR